MEDDTGPDQVDELLSYIERLRTKAADHEQKVADHEHKAANHERRMAIFGQLGVVCRMASDLMVGQLGETHAPTKTERQAIIAAVRAIQSAKIAEHALNDVHHDGEQAMIAAEVCIILAAYQVGYAQATADQYSARKSAAAVRKDPRRAMAAERLAEAIERAARTEGSAANLAEQLAPVVGKSVRHVARLIGSKRRAARQE